MRLPSGTAAAFFALVLALTGCASGQTHGTSIAARTSELVGQPVRCSPTGDLGIWPEYDANTPLYSCVGSRRSWCIVEPPQPFRDLFGLHAVADVTGGMLAVFGRDAWGVRPACLRWHGVRRLAAAAG